LEPGHYHALVSDYGGLFRSAMTPRVAFLDHYEEVEVRVPGARIAGVVLEEDRTPVGGARVSAMFLDGQDADAGPGPMMALLRTATTGEDGSFRLEAMASGQWMLKAKSGDRRAEPKGLNLHAEEALVGVEVVIPTGQDITGLLRDSAGQPVAGANGVVAFSPAGKIPHGPGASWTTGPAGFFTLRSLREEGEIGNFQVKTNAVIAAVRMPVADGMTLQLPSPGSDVVLRINMRHWASQFVVNVYLVAESGAYVAAGYAGIPGAMGTDGWRNYRIPLLAAGSWVVVAVNSPAEIRALGSGAGGTLPAVAHFVSQGGEVIELEVP
jgi:hypothetical protein